MVSVHECLAISGQETVMRLLEEHILMMKTNQNLQTSNRCCSEKIVSELIRSALQPEFLTILVEPILVLTFTISLVIRITLLSQGLLGVGTIAMFSYQNPSLKSSKGRKDFQFLLLNLQQMRKKSSLKSETSGILQKNAN